MTAKNVLSSFTSNRWYHRFRSLIKKYIWNTWNINLLFHSFEVNLMTYSWFFIDINTFLHIWHIFFRHPKLDWVNSHSFKKYLLHQWLIQIKEIECFVNIIILSYWHSLIYLFPITVYVLLAYAIISFYRF